MGRGPPVPPSHLQPAFIGLLGGYEAHGVPGGHLLVGFPPHMVRTVDKIPCTFERGRLADPSYRLETWIKRSGACLTTLRRPGLPSFTLVIDPDSSGKNLWDVLASCRSGRVNKLENEQK